MNKTIVSLICATLVLAAIPALDMFFALGTAWPAVPPTFTDETFYQGHVENIAVKGQLNDGNAYFLEDAGQPPPVIFGGAWVNAIPQWLGIPLMPSLYLNFAVFSVAFTLLFYWLLRELWTPRAWAALGSLALYLQCYAHVWRPANLQPVYPAWILFYIGIARLIKKQSSGNIWLTGLAAGASFYLYAYLWQAVVITLGLLLLYAILAKAWPLARATLWASLIGGLLGAPVPLYTLWLARTYPYYWETMERFGLVYTRLPMMEVVYSGGWVALVLALLAFWYWKAPGLRARPEWGVIVPALLISGLGLWIMQGSNLITGLLLETGEHLRILILPWLLMATIVLGAFLWRSREDLSRGLRTLSFTAIAVFALASSYYTYYYAQPFIAPDAATRAAWIDQQTYAGVFEWLEANEPRPVVVWTDPHLYISTDLPVFTRHYVLYTSMGLWQLVPNEEIRERYLTASYFDKPAEASLRTEKELRLFAGRKDAYHAPATVAREIKLCKLMLMWDTARSCGSERSPAELLGDAYFTKLERQFSEEIAPRITKYLSKYHVSYVLKDTIHNASWRPQALGARPVYTDGRYELYKLP